MINVVYGYWRRRTCPEPVRDLPGIPFAIFDHPWPRLAAKLALSGLRFRQNGLYVHQPALDDSSQRAAPPVVEGTVVVATTTMACLSSSIGTYPVIASAGATVGRQLTAQVLAEPLRVVGDGRL